MSFCPWYSLQADIYSSKFHHWITVIWKGWDLDIIWKKTFPLQSVILFLSPLLWSVVLDGIGQLARGMGKLYKTFHSCARIFLSSTIVTLKFKSPQEFTANLTWNWGVSHYLLTKAYTQPLYNPFTLSMCQNASEPVFTSLILQCTHGVSLGLLELQAAFSLHLPSSWERVVLSLQCTRYCVPLHTCHDSSPNAVATGNYLMPPDSTTTPHHLHTWQLCVHSYLSKRRISHYPWAPRIMKSDNGG